MNEALVATIKQRRSNVLYAKTIDSMAKCVEQPGFLDQETASTLLVAAREAMASQRDEDYRNALGKAAPMACAVRDMLALDREFTMTCLDAVARSASQDVFAATSAKRAVPSAPSYVSAILGLLILLSLVVIPALFVITSREAIPDRARFLVNQKMKLIVPEPVPGGWHKLPGGDGIPPFNPIDTTVTWGDIRRKEHPFHDFELPDAPGWRRMDYLGREISLFRSVFFPPDSRWDEEGRWRY